MITKMDNMMFRRAFVASPLVLHVQVACAHVWRAPHRSPLAVVGEARAVVGEDHIVDGHELDLVHEVLEVDAVAVLVLHESFAVSLFWWLSSPPDSSWFQLELSNLVLHLVHCSNFSSADRFSALTRR